MHDPHEGKGSYLFEGCDRCSELATNIEELDDPNLEALAQLARLIHDGAISGTSLSYPELRAIAMLRLWTRIVEASGMASEVAR